MSRSLNSGSFTVCNSASLNFFNTLGGKSAGPISPYQVDMSYVGNPDSAMVGILGAALERVLVVTPSARNCPCSANATPVGRFGKAISTVPAMRCGKRLPEPLYGICTISTPESCLNNSPDKWTDEPYPDEAKLILPGLARP